MGGVKDHGAGLFSKVPNAAFSDPILPMGIDAAVSNSLVLLSQAFFPRVVNKSPIVSVVVADFDAEITSKEFKGILGLKGFQRGGILLQVNVADTAVVVNEDSGYAVATSSEASLQLRNETNMPRLHLVNRDTLPRGSSWLNMMALQLGAPGFPGSFAEGAGGTHGGIALGESRWYFAPPSHGSKFRK
jgi:hypothetical protein